MLTKNVVKKWKNKSCSKLPEMARKFKIFDQNFTFGVFKNCSNLVTMFGCTDLNSFWTISRYGDLASFYGLLCCDCGSNAVVLNTNIGYFRAT